MAKTRDDLADALGEELAHELGARGALFEQALADRLGLNATDYRCLRIAVRHARRGLSINAGALAEETALTTGAITGVLDRLEKAGLIRRERDPADRRQVRVSVVEERLSDMRALREPFARAWRTLAGAYTRDELELVGRFVHEAVSLLREETDRLRAQPDAGLDALSAPLGDASSGVLDVKGGISHVRVRVAAGPHLYRARFDGATPRVAVHDGRVELTLTRSLLRVLKGARDECEIVLSKAIPWSVRVRGGATHLTVDLRGAVAESIQIDGGAHDVALTLPSPRGTASVRIRGGVNGLRLIRPAAAPARLHVAHGASGLTIDTLHLGAVGGAVRWQSPEYEGATDRWDVAIHGGARALTVGTN
jgi:DNA-binding MarR family transcriptional regulator